MHLCPFCNRRTINLLDDDDDDDDDDDTSLLVGVRRGVFTCVEWQVTLCDPIWQVTLRGSRTSSRRGLHSALTFQY